MNDQYKSQEEILQKLGIEALNEMQQEAYQSIITTQDTILLSPTGTGKTLAFLLPILEQLDPNLEQTQVMIFSSFKRVSDTDRTSHPRYG